MLKLVRNTLGEYVLLVDKDGQKVLWQYITELHKLQEREGPYFVFYIMPGENCGFLGCHNSRASSGAKLLFFKIPTVSDKDGEDTRN